MTEPAILRDQPSTHTRRFWRQPLAWSALALAVLAISGVMVAVLDRSAAAETRSSFQWTTHTLEVQDELHKALAALAEAESAQRGYDLSSDTVYLANYAGAAAAARAFLGTVRQLTADNQAQQRRLDTLDRLVDARLARLQAGAALVQRGQRDSVESVLRTAGGHLLMDSIRVTVSRAVESEGVLLATRQRSVEDALKKRRTAEELIVGLAVLAMILAGAVSFRLRRAERLVTMCAWSKAIEFDGEWMSIEAYMARRFGISITHGISPTEIQRLETEMDGTSVLAGAIAGVPSRKG